METMDRQATDAAMDLAVTSYWVGADREVGGKHIRGYPLIPALATRMQAEVMQDELLAEYPDAKICEQTEFCRDQADRDRAVERIVYP